MNNETKKTIIASFGLILLVVLLSQSHEPAGITKLVEGKWDISNQTSEYHQFLIEESDFDYSHPEIQKVAEDIKMSTTSAKDALTTTIRYVASSIQYDPKVTISSCYQEKASTVILSGKGDCVSMSRLVTALLRAQGIPARTSGGCLSASRRCSPLFSAVPGLEPKSVVMSMGDYKKRGFLHEWVEAYTPQTGWILIEATSGQTFPLDCVTYLQYSYDTNNVERCVINDNTFWEQCRRY